MSNNSFSDPNGRRHQFDAGLEERPPFPLQSEEEKKDFNSDGNNFRITPLKPYNFDFGVSGNVRPKYSAFSPEVLGNVAQGICLYRNSIFVSVVMQVIYQGAFMIAQQASPNRAIDGVGTLLLLGLVLSIWPVWLAIQSSKLLYKTPSKIAPNVKKNNVKKNIVTSWVIWGAGVILFILNCLFLGVSGKAEFFTALQIISILLCGVGTLYYLAVMSELAWSVLKVKWGDGAFISYIVVGLCLIFSLFWQGDPEASGNAVAALGAVGSIAAFYFLYCIDQLKKLFVPLLAREKMEKQMSNNSFSDPNGRRHQFDTGFEEKPPFPLQNEDETKNYPWGRAIAIAFLIIFASPILIGGIISVMETQEYTSVLAEQKKFEKILPDLASKETNALREWDEYSTKYSGGIITDQEYTQGLNDGFLASCKEQKALLDSVSLKNLNPLYDFYQKMNDGRIAYGTLIMEAVSQQSGEKYRAGLRLRIQTELELLRYYVQQKLPITIEAIPNISLYLYYAACVGDIELAQMALAHGADINYTIGNYTPLLVALEEGHLDMVQFLKERGAKEPAEPTESDKPAASTDESQPDSKTDLGAAPEEPDLKPGNPEKESAELSLDSKKPAD